jgi:chaperonin GroEL (HSP60 family)
MQKFADGIEELPSSLARNVGMDSLDAQVRLYARAANDYLRYGIDVFAGRTSDLSRLGAYEPLAIKAHVINAATEVVSMISGWTT